MKHKVLKVLNWKKKGRGRKGRNYKKYTDIWKELNIKTPEIEQHPWTPCTWTPCTYILKPKPWDFNIIIAGIPAHNTLNIWREIVLSSLWRSDGECAGSDGVMTECSLRDSFASGRRSELKVKVTCCYSWQLHSVILPVWSAVEHSRTLKIVSVWIFEKGWLYYIFK